MVFTETDVPQIKKRIFAWATVYYETIKSAVQRYPNHGADLPDSLQLHPRQMRLVVTPETFTLWGLKSDEPWTAEWQEDEEPLSAELLREAGVWSRIEAFKSKRQNYRISAFQLSSKNPDSRYEKMVISSTCSAKSWTADNARAEASNDVLTATIRNLLGPSSQEVSEEVRAEPQKVVARRLQHLISDFEEILSDASREEELQLFLKEHPYLLDLRAISVDPKVPLGSEYVTDFVVRLPGSQYLLVEIERASHALYTSAHNPSAALTHAIRQVEDWLEWSYENLSYLRGKYSDIHEPKGLVILGRRSSLDHKATKALRRRNVLSKVQVATYDDLIDDMRAIASNLERGTIPTSTGVAYN